MANRASKSPAQPVDQATAAFQRATLNDGPAHPVLRPHNAASGHMQNGARPPPPSLAAKAGPGGMKRNRPGFKLSDITGDPNGPGPSGGAAGAGLGAGAPSLAEDSPSWPPRRPQDSFGTPFSNFGKIVYVFLSCPFALLFRICCSSLVCRMS